MPHTRQGDDPDGTVLWVPADLFGFLRALAASDLPRDALRAALLIADTGKGATGRGAVVDEGALASTMRVSPRTVWRVLDQLRGTWLVQTVTPTRNIAGHRGRRARYDLRVPVSVPPNGAESSAKSPRDVTDENPGIVCQIDGNRLSNPGESSVTTERVGGTLSPSYGSPSFGTPSIERPPSATSGMRAESQSMDGETPGRADPGPGRRPGLDLGDVFRAPEPTDYGDRPRDPRETP